MDPTSLNVSQRSSWNPMLQAKQWLMKYARERKRQVLIDDMLTRSSIIRTLGDSGVAILVRAFDALYTLGGEKAALTMNEGILYLSALRQSFEAFDDALVHESASRLTRVGQSWPRDTQWAVDAIVRETLYVYASKPDIHEGQLPELMQRYILQHCPTLVLDKEALFNHDVANEVRPGLLAFAECLHGLDMPPIERHLALREWLDSPLHVSPVSQLPDDMVL